MTISIFILVIAESLVAGFNGTGCGIQFVSIKGLNKARADTLIEENEKLPEISRF